MAILLKILLNIDAVRMRTLDKVMAARHQQENHVTRYPVIYTTSQFRSAHAHARSRVDPLRSTRITSTYMSCWPRLVG